MLAKKMTGKQFQVKSNYIIPLNRQWFFKVNSQFNTVANSFSFNFVFKYKTGVNNRIKTFPVLARVGIPKVNGNYSIFLINFSFSYFRNRRPLPRSGVETNIAVCRYTAAKLNYC